MAEGEANRKEDMKMEISEDIPSDLESRIIRQIEYYFGDMNLPRDKFLKKQIKLDEGWVPLTVLLTFNRLKSLTIEPEVIVAAVIKSPSQLLEVSEDRQKVRRNFMNHPMPELNEERNNELIFRTVYVKGLPEGSTIDIFLELFKKYNEEDIIMKKFFDKVSNTWISKGSAFVIFKTKEDAANFMEEESVSYNGVELERMWKLEHLQLKCSEKKSRFIDKSIEHLIGNVLLLLDVPETISLDQINDSIFGLGGKIAFIELKDGNALIVLRKKNSARKVFERCIDSKITVGGVDFNCALIEGEAEVQFFNNWQQSLSRN